MTFTRLPGHTTVAEAIDWCASRGFDALLERGPDGTIRGIAFVADEALVLERKAAALEATAERMRT